MGRVVYDKLLLKQYPGLLRGALPLLSRADAVISANRESVAQWLEYDPSATADWTYVPFPVVMHVDGAHMARARTCTKIPQLSAHLPASTPAVASVASMMGRLIEGIKFPYRPECNVGFCAKLLLCANDLKGIKEQLGKLGFGAAQDMVFYDDFGLFNFAPISFQRRDTEEALALGGKAALRAELAMNRLPEIKSDLADNVHGSLHGGTCGKGTLMQFAKLHYAIGGQANHKDYLAYLPRRLGWPVECNLKERETTRPFGGKTGHMLKAFSINVDALLGYKPTLHRGSTDANGTIKFVLDAIAAFTSIMLLVRNYHQAFVAFSELAVAAAFVANSLAITRCRATSQEVGYTITLGECLETKEEDLHRHVACRTVRCILKEWSFYQHNFLQKTKLLSSLRTLLREERALRKRGDALYDEVSPVGAFSAFWLQRSGEPTLLATLLGVASNKMAPRRAASTAGAAGGVDVDSSDDAVDEAVTRILEEADDDPPDGDGPDDPLREDEDAGGDDPPEPELLSHNPEENDELADPVDEELGVFVAQSVELLEAKLRVGGHEATIRSGEWTLALRTRTTKTQREENVYAHSLSNPEGHDKARLDIVLLGSPDFGVFNAATKNYNLAAKDASDTGPFRTISATATLLRCAARLTAQQGFSTLREAWKNTVGSSAYLQKRAGAVVPRRAPEGYDPVRAAEAERDKRKTMPLAVEAERPRIRAQAEKLIDAFL
ncbi:hypothetical protein M885DRAFT_573346 [Pelagophyceae sp. CCMP2097]|nr:hypothetical protein M885DRAFT_573346 [Pelagophyceae sp. CCMP2097]